MQNQNQFAETQVLTRSLLLVLHHFGIQSSLPGFYAEVHMLYLNVHMHAYIHVAWRCTVKV